MARLRLPVRVEALERPNQQRRERQRHQQTQRHHHDCDCEADHGFEGTLAADDISLRISADADGDAALARALHFASALSATIGR